MAGCLPPLLLADADTVQLLVYGAIILVTVLGGLLQKKKEEEGRSKPAPPRTPFPSQRTPAPPPQRPPVRARPPVRRPEVEPPPWQAQRPVPARSPRPASGDASEAARPRAPVPPVGVAAGEFPAPGRGPDRASSAPPRRARRSSAYTAAQLQALLRKPQSVQTAIVLSEVLGPPVALRD